MEIEQKRDLRNLLQLGNKYESEGLLMKAITESFAKIVKMISSDSPLANELFCRMGLCYFKLAVAEKGSDKYKLAAHYLKKFTPDNAEVLGMIGNCYGNCKDYATAEKYFLKSHALNPSDINVSYSLANVFFYTKQYEKSIHFYRLAYGGTTYGETTYGDPTRLYQSSFPHLARGDYEQGWALYEQRLVTPTSMRAELPFLPTWDGMSKCASLLVVAEQGLGDIIQYYRFVLETSARFPDMKITFFCKTELAHLFDTACITIITQFTMDMIPLYNYKIYLMSLPFALRIREIRPISENYIRFTEKQTEEWNRRLLSLTADRRRLRVGFVCSGLLVSFIDKNIPLQKFIDAFSDVKDVDFICIHRKSDRLLDADPSPPNFHFFDDLDVTCRPFEDTIHILRNLDLLITVDTVIVHLAGVMNVKTWLLLGHSDWRWSDHPSATYWYSCVELVRNPLDRKFEDVLLGSVKEKLLSFSSSVADGLL